jgi:hypothetical protein
MPRVTARAPGPRPQVLSNSLRGDFIAIPRARLFFVSLCLTLVLMAALAFLDQSLKTPAAPRGIISLEMARTPERADHILASWGEVGRIQAGISLGLDYFFLLAYAATLAGACRLVSDRLNPIVPLLGGLGRLLAWGQWCAAVLDAAENMALIQMILGQGKAWHPAMASFCAVPKFALVGVGLLYILGGGLLLAWKRGVSAPRL